MIEPGTPTEFEVEVAELFRLLGYEVVTQLPISSKRPDSFVIDRYGVGKPHRVLVECKRYTKEKVGPDDFTRFLNLVNVSRHQGLVESGIMVSIHGATPAVLAETQDSTCPVEVITIADLRHKLFNPRAYLNIAVDEWRSDNVIYVDRQGAMRGSRVAIPDLRSFVRDLAVGPGRGLTVLFGGAGSGKSTQLRQLALDLGEACLRHERVPVPIYLSLLDYSRSASGSVDRYIYETLKVFYPEPTPKWSFLKRMISKGRIVLLLDGFDEMRNIHKSKMVVSELINILTVIGPEANWFMTCRSPILDSETEVIDAFLVRPRRRFPNLEVRILDLAPFSPQEAEQYLLLAGKVSLRERIFVGDIADLCKRPILLNFLVDVYSSGEPRETPLSENSIIDEVVDYMLENRIETHESMMDLSEWRSLLEVCALEMLIADQGYLERGRLSKIVVEHFGRDLHEIDIRPVAAHARTRTLFDLGDGGLIFQHQIFRDFLAAFALARHLARPGLAGVALDGLWIGAEVLRHLDYAIQRCSQTLTLFKPMDIGEPRLPHRKFCWIPPGLYVTGRSPSEGRGAILRYLHSGFWITKMPITIAEYREFLATTPLLQVPRSSDHGRLPLTNVSFEEAEALALAAGGRLPTEEEWELAAGWVDGSYPRRKQIPSVPAESEYPPRVGLADANPWGVYDATGCVWQWTSTRDAVSGINVVKGAYWGSSMESKLLVGERLVPNQSRHLRTGFRIVVAPGES